MPKPLSAALIILILCCGGLTSYLIKYRVQDVQKELQAARLKLQTEEEAVRILEAEWAYLIRPERLQELQARYLQLVPYQAQQITSIDNLPVKVQQGAVQ